MNYDSWKLSSGVTPEAEALEDRCTSIEADVDRALSLAVERTSHPADAQWSIEPALAEPDQDGAISLEVSLRLKRLPVTGQPEDLQELAQAIINLGECLSVIARNQQPSSRLKFAPTA